MSICLKDIEGAVVEKKIDESAKLYGYCGSCYNEGIETQASVKIRHKREKLVKIIRLRFMPLVKHIDTPFGLEWTDKTVNEILANEKELFEVEK